MENYSHIQLMEEVKLSPSQWIDKEVKSLFLPKDHLSLIENWCHFLKIDLDNEKKEKTLFILYGEDDLTLQNTASYIAMKLQGQILLTEVVSSKSPDNIISDPRAREEDEMRFNALSLLEIEKFNKAKHLKVIQNFIEDAFTESTVNFIITKGSLPQIIENKDINCIEISIDIPDSDLRGRIWNYYLSEIEILNEIKTESLNNLVQIYQLYEGQIRNAVYLTRNKVKPLGEKAKDVFEKELIQSCQYIAQTALNEMTVPINSPYSIEDLVLRPNAGEVFMESIQFIKNRHHIYHTYGIESRQYGKGVNLLFAGESGTGKTMGASVLANEIGLPAYKVNMAAIVSKWHGETEKNITKIFDEAKNTNVVLFFDEADSLFHKRGEEKSGQNQNNNMAIGLLLQKMEEHEGICILATNLYDNMDEAFRRRFNFIIDFYLPGNKERLAIWNNVFKDTSILSEDPDFEKLAMDYDISGANIQSAAQLALSYAMEENSKITMDHLKKASQREMEKNGDAFPFHNAK